MKKIIDIRKKIKNRKMVKRWNVPMEIKDMRNHGYFTVDNLFVDEYVRQCGLCTAGVYFSLCRHANRDRQCWPSIRLIAEEIKITPRRIISGIKWLEEHGLIRIDRMKGESNVYELMEKAKWKKFKVVKFAVGGVRVANKKEIEGFKELNEEGAE